MLIVRNSWKRLSNDFAVKSFPNSSIIAYVGETHEEAKEKDLLYVVGSPCKKHPSHNTFYVIDGDKRTKHNGTIRYANKNSACVHCKRDISVQRRRSKYNETQAEKLRKGEARRRAELIKEARELGLDPEDLL